MLIRKGASDNVMVFPESDYDNNAFGFSNGQYTFSHKAYGADSFRYSWNFGRNWTQWKSWEDTTFIDGGVFDTPDNFWPGQHILVQCKFTIASISINTDVERYPKIGATLRNPPVVSFMPIAATVSNVAYHNCSLVDRLMPGVTTRVSRPK